MTTTAAARPKRRTTPVPAAPAILGEAEAAVQWAFLAVIAENPDDDTPRLVFADWLQDNGQPERAEFIRAQIELTDLLKDVRDGDLGRVEELRDRSHALLRPQRLWDWFGIDGGLPTSRPKRVMLGKVEQDSLVCKVGYPDGRRKPKHWKLGVRRGFISAVELGIVAFETHGPALVSRHPIERVCPSYLPVSQMTNDSTGQESFALCRWHWHKRPQCWPHLVRQAAAARRQGRAMAGLPDDDGLLDQCLVSQIVFWNAIDFREVVSAGLLSWVRQEAKLARDTAN